MYTWTEVYFCTQTSGLESRIIAFGVINIFNFLSFLNWVLLIFPGKASCMVYPDVLLTSHAWLSRRKQRKRFTQNQNCLACWTNWKSWMASPCLASNMVTRACPKSRSSTRLGYDNQLGLSPRSNMHSSRWYSPYVGRLDIGREVRGESECTENGFRNRSSWTYSDHQARHSRLLGVCGVFCRAILNPPLTLVSHKRTSEKVERHSDSATHSWLSWQSGRQWPNSRTLLGSE